METEALKALSAIGLYQSDKTGIKATDLENRENLKTNSGWLTVIAIVMIVLGMIVIASPLFASV